MPRQKKSTVDITIKGKTFKDVDLDKVGDGVGNIGHNNPPRPGGIAVEQLKSIIARIENLEEEKAGIAGDIKDVYGEAKGNGFDVKTLRKIIQLRKQDAAEREEQEHLLETYKRAIGMSPSFDDEAA